MIYVWVDLATLLLTTLTAVSVYLWLPAYRSLLVTENSLVENAGAFFFFATFVLGLIFRSRRPRHRTTFLVLSIVGLLGALDELSFGQSLLDFEPPVVSGVPIDAPHDLVRVG